MFSMTRVTVKRFLVSLLRRCSILISASFAFSSCLQLGELGVFKLHSGNNFTTSRLAADTKHESGPDQARI